MSPAFAERPVAEYQDAVGALNRRETMGDNHRGSFGQQLTER
jgi:hypothetical protein